MELSIIAILILWLVIGVTALLSRLDARNNNAKEVEGESRDDENSENENISESNFELKPQESVLYILSEYYSDECELGFYDIYKKLLDRVCEIPYDDKDWDMYHELVKLFWESSIKFEREQPMKLFDSNYGMINRGHLKRLQELNVSLLQSAMRSAERALESKQFFRVFKIDLGFIYLTMQYYSFICPDETEFMRVKRIGHMVSKRMKVQEVICEIYMANLQGDYKKIEELVGKCMDFKLITEQEKFEVSSALKWMEESEQEKRILSKMK